jgi:hypothetical protein
MEGQRHVRHCPSEVGHLKIQRALGEMGLTVKIWCLRQLTSSSFSDVYQKMRNTKKK